MLAPLPFVLKSSPCPKDVCFFVLPGAPVWLRPKAALGIETDLVLRRFVLKFAFVFPQRKFSQTGRELIRTRPHQKLARRHQHHLRAIA